MWLTQMEQHVDPETAICIVGNKTDLGSDRQVTKAEAEAFAAARSMKYFEVSAKTFSGVATPYYHLTEMLLDRQLGAPLLGEKEEEKS